MSSHTVRLVSECFVKPLNNNIISQDDIANQPILYLTPFELTLINVSYSQKGLLFSKPPPDHDNHDFSLTVFLDRLRHSLSATLSHFYPLAACLAIKHEKSTQKTLMYVDLEKRPGVKFIHAIVDDVTVSDVLNSDDDVHSASVVHSFFDLNDAINLDGHTQPLLSIQVTELTDGIFIGGSVNHLLADGTSFWHFMLSWSEIFRSKNDENGYNFISRPPIFKKFDPVITSLRFINHDQFIERSDDQKQSQVIIKERFFHFSSAAVSKLKAKANIECNTKNISSLQAVSALLWRCVTRVRRQPGKSETVCKLLVNNRSRVNPPMSNDYFGSPIDIVSGTATVEDLMAHGLGWAALRIHETVTNYDNATIKKWVESWFRNPVVYKKNGLFHPNTVHIGSSPRFDMYGCEFGLGKAVAARSGLVNKADGKMTMYPGREGGGSMDVEACLLPEYMMDLECDQEFISGLKGMD